MSGAVRPAAGSSSSSSFGSSASARAISSSRCLPYGRLRASSFAAYARPTNCSSENARSRAPASSRRARGVCRPTSTRFAVERVMQADEHVLERGHLAEQLHVLERPCDARQRDLRRRLAADLLVAVHDRARGRRVDAGQHVHHRALAGAVRSDQSVDRAAADRQVDVVERLQSAELHQHAAHVEDRPAGVDVRRRVDRLAVRRRVGLRRVDRDADGSSTEIEQRAHEADDAVLQVIDDEQDHQSEDRQTPVGDRVEVERERREADRADDRDRDALRGREAACERDAGADGDDDRERGRDDAERADVVEHLRQQHDDQRAEDRAAARLAAAHDDREQEQHRQLEVVRVRRDVLLRIRVQRAGEAREAGADDERVDLVAIDRDAHAVGRDRAVAQRLERAPEMRLQDAVHDDQREHEDERDEPVVVALVEAVSRTASASTA